MLNPDTQGTFMAPRTSLQRKLYKQKSMFHFRKCKASIPGGGTSILKVSGTCRWQGYDFAIIAIKTGCLNQPNHWHRVSNSAYLATGMDYSVYQVGSLLIPPTMFMTGPRSRHRRDATRRCVRDQYSNDP